MTDNKVKKILKDRRIELGYTMKEIAKMVGVSEGTVSRWESGDIANMRRDRIAKLSKALQLSPSVIMGWDEPNQVFEAAAGQGRICDAPTDTISMSLDDDQSYVTVHGSSMEPVLQDGDIVVVSATNIVRSQEEIMLVKINGDEATLKHVKYTNDGIYLIAENPAVYRAHFYSDKDIEELPVTIEGVVVKLIREL